MKAISRYAVIFLLFLSLLSIAILLFITKPVPPESIVSEVSENLQSEIKALEGEATVVLKDVQAGNSLSSPSEKFSFFLYENGKLNAWSDYQFVPSPASVQEDFRLKLLKEGNGDYLVRRWSVSDHEFLIGVIPLSRRYPIVNNYLKPAWNADVFFNNQFTILDANSSEGYQICVGVICPFKIQFATEQLNFYNGAKILTALLMLASVVLALWILFRFLFTKKLSLDIIFLLIAGTLLCTRFMMVELELPARFIAGDLFNPKIFASSTINGSLGDLLLNEISLLILCVFIFRNLFNFRIIHYLKRTKAGDWFLSIFSAFAGIFAILFLFVVIQTLYNNSSIILSINDSVRFDALRISALFAIIIAGISSFLFSHVFFRLLTGKRNQKQVFLSFLLGAVAFSIINYASGQLFLSTVVLSTLYFLLIFMLNLQGSLRRVTFATFTYLFLSLFFVSVNGSYAIRLFSLKEKLNNQFRFARNFLVERDYFGEYLLRELSENVSRDVFIQSRIATPFLGKDVIKQKIRQVFLPSYFNKYDIEIYTFNAAGESTDNHAGTFSRFLVNYDHDAFKTDYEQVYYINTPATDVSQKYLVVVPITWMRSIAGQIVIEFTLKKIIPETVYPELLVDNRFLQYYHYHELSYGIFVNGKLSSSYGDFNYENFTHGWLGDTELHTIGMSRDGYDHIAEEDEAGRVIVVSSRSTSWINSAANFSFLLVIGLITILFFLIAQSVLVFVRGGTLYLSARIQLFLNLAFFLPLIIVSAVSLGVTSRSSKQQINEEYLNKARRFSEVVSDKFVTLQRREPGDDGFENNFVNLVQLANLDANVYSPDGALLVTSQPLVFENKILSEYINPAALKSIHAGNNIFINKEKISELEFYSAYAALREPTTARLVGILEIPFFQSVYSAEKSQISILINILNIFALIFIVLIALSYFVTQWLTFPLTFITQSLKRISLTRTNQPLVWKSDDEIGLMVKEYNQMLYSLSESKAELEQTQRERAWREIAQQVAHEIKNPLTPMKLTLQQLERSIEEGKASPEKVSKSISSLLIQVNTLNEIASSFSAFAKMPEPVMKTFELNSLLRRIVDLHSHSGELKLETLRKEVMVNGDEQLLGRTFSNIILNALQATRPGEQPKVLIRCLETDGVIQLQFIDNGKGIEPNVAERIFVPHFTTKKSGSGLGLAISKQAIEQMKGRLWFESQPGKGTTFFIELPETITPSTK